MKRFTFAVLGNYMASKTEEKAEKNRSQWPRAPSNREFVISDQNNPPWIAYNRDILESYKLFI